MSDQFKYRAFISYSHRDNLWATWLHRTLENYKPPRKLWGQPGQFGPVPKRLSPIFRDRDELPTATDLSSIINRALADSACLLVICSPTAAASKWVNEEIIAFKQLGREHRIFCLIVDGEPYASDHPEWGLKECFPEALRYKIGPDGKLTTERTEPIAADARPGKDGKANAKLKLIAGMLGVGFDALRQRELHRRQRRMVAIASAATVGMLVTTGLATMALIAREEAEEQRLAAEEERDTAEAALDIMKKFFRVADPTEALGREITVREVLDRNTPLLETELAGQPELQATLMDTLGSVYMNLTLYAEAQPLIEKALASRREVLGRTHPDSAASQANLGEVLRQQAEYEASEIQFREALEIQREQLGDSDPVVASTLSGLAELLVELGRFDEAEDALREALRIRRTVYGEEHSEVARTLEDLAWTIFEGGEPEAGQTMMEEALAMQRRVWDNSPHPYLAETINNLATLLYLLGDYKRTEELFHEGLEMNRVLLGDKHRDLAASINNLAMVLHDQGQYEQAETMYRDALAMQADLVGEHHPAYANALNNLAYLQYDKGDVSGALAYARSAVSIYGEFFPQGHADYAATLAGIGAWLIEGGELGEAETTVRAALDMRASVLGTDTTDYANSEVQLAMIFVSTDRFEEALELARGARAILASELPVDHWRTAMASAVEGAALAGLGEDLEGEALMSRAYDILSNDAGALPVYVREARRYLYRYFSVHSQPEKAAPYATP